MVVQTPFDQKKASILKEISLNSDQNLDASPKGTIDKFCIPIIELINSKSNFVTTSSCSGRVSVYLEGNKNSHLQIGAKGNEGKWIFVTHDPTELKDWYKKINFTYKSEGYTGNLSSHDRHILYKFEPLILHVKCRDKESAIQLYQCAMACGFRESGIGSNNLVAIRISIKLDIPIGIHHEGNSVLFVTEEYLRFITQLSMDRFEENFSKTEQLHKAIESLQHSCSCQNTKSESKEERRERKMREGLARRDEARVLKEKMKHDQLQEQVKQMTTAQ